MLGGALSAEDVPELLSQERDHAVLAADEFEGLGWPLPDGGRAVKAIADAAPGGAFDPRRLEKAAPGDLGYRAAWHVVRYRYYGLDWDITGLQLSPNAPGTWTADAGDHPRRIRELVRVLPRSAQRAGPRSIPGAASSRSC